MLFTSKKSWLVVYNDESEGGEGSGEGEGGGSGGSGGGGATPTLATLVKEHNLQDQLNTMIASNRKGLTQKNLEIVQQLERLKSQETVNASEKEELEQQIEELRTQHLSTEEMAKHTADKTGKEHQRILDALTVDNNKWKNLYENQTTQRSLLDAAAQGEAVRAEQIVSILESMTSVVEVTDSVGKGTGVYKTVVQFNDVNEDGESVTIALSPIDAVNRMKELPKLYGNLFKGTSTGGLGASGNDGGGNKAMTLAEITKDRETYKKWRDENPNLDLSKIK